MLSPESKVYTENKVPVVFNMTYTDHYPDVQVSWFEYYLDNGGPVVFSADQSEPVVGRTILSGLTEGSHTLTVVAVVGLGYRSWATYPSTIYVEGYCSSNTVFAVDAAPPQIKVLSIKQQGTFNETSIPLVFSITEPTQRISYSLDQQANQSITGNTTLTHLSNGTHYLELYAVDTTGTRGASQPISFNIKTQEPQSQATEPELQPSNPEPFPTTLLIASLAAVAAVSIGLLVYFKKRKR